MFFYNFLNVLFNVITFAIFGRVILSWLDPMGGWAVTKIVRDITEPILAPIRKILPPTGMFDLSPVIVLVIIQVIQSVVLR